MVQNKDRRRYMFNQDVSLQSCAVISVMLVVRCACFAAFDSKEGQHPAICMVTWMWASVVLCGPPSAGVCFARFAALALERMSAPSSLHGQPDNTLAAPSCLWAWLCAVAQQLGSEAMGCHFCPIWLVARAEGGQAAPRWAPSSTAAGVFEIAALQHLHCHQGGKG